MKILIPTDFSENAWHTLQYVVELMKNTPCSFSLIHTYEISNSSSGEIITVNDFLKSQAEQKLKTLKSKAEEISNKALHNFSYSAFHGDFIRVINRFMQEETFDMLAISLTNKCYPDKTAHKNYAKKLVEISNLPVIIIPDCVKGLPVVH